MFLDRLFGDDERRGDLPVLEAVRHSRQDLQLAAGEGLRDSGDRGEAVAGTSPWRQCVLAA